MVSIDKRNALSFGAIADDYDRFRPRYPVTAIEWAVGDSARDVVDLAAGTGILTRQLIDLGHRVVPVEPDPGMRAGLVAATPGVTALAGSAETMPLPDDSADSVVAGQAYHWFDREAAAAEVARVLRPGGTFAPIWNDRDERVPWVAALTEIADRTRAGKGLLDPAPELETLGAQFGELERAEFAHSTTHTVETLIALIRTRSYYITARASDRLAIESAIRDLATTHPDLSGHEKFELPYRTIVYRASTLRS